MTTPAFFECLRVAECLPSQFLPSCCCESPNYPTSARQFTDVILLAQCQIGIAASVLTGHALDVAEPIDAYRVFVCLIMVSFAAGYAWLVYAIWEWFTALPDPTGTRTTFANTTYRVRRSTRVAI